MTLGSFQQQIDAELTRYETLTNSIQAMEKKVQQQMSDYELIFNSYINAVQIIENKTEGWRRPRAEKISKVCQRLQAKWENPKSVLQSNPQLEQDEQIFQAVLRIHYKRPADQASYRKKRFIEIQKELDKIVMPKR